MIEASYYLSDIEHIFFVLFSLELDVLVAICAVYERVRRLAIL